VNVMRPTKYNVKLFISFGNLNNIGFILNNFNDNQFLIINSTT
jgi:hypothetical protein